MSSPAPGSTKFPFSPLPDSVDAYMAEQGMLSVSEEHINNVLTQSGIRAECIYLPPHLSRFFPARFIYILSQFRFEAYRASMIMRICNFWYLRRYEYLHPDEDSSILQRYIQSVQLLLGWDKDNKPVKDQPIAVADQKIPESSITLGSHRRIYTAYKEFYDDLVWNSRCGVYYARFFVYLQLATKNFDSHLPSDVLPAFNAWKQGDFHTEILKLVPLSRSVPYSPLYEVAMDELATAITQKVEGGEAIARTWKAFATGPHSY
ncbi:uncharacterized protein BO88DRAFT_434065 [Aspergillus vadensis CBS 113365]|uniref:Uncharacterized protein n=1 Tax=Aspergillus vadensis (strain CBS 113365 / IMI 142717 / IBT 24658) TaxID=1448311 RepID=A0A319BEZ5_ASPVC|nr:hypothetical protein BO88DRAFT_434065 [Aspergillus vadensis CBS 113365]PYH71315.1 hypothetical protein BO88DRAFT_434065 [Aspergillus vadensis CBS 113365]